jgi:hypothetical protein
MIMKKKKLSGIIFFLFLLLISIFLSFYSHKKSGYYNWKSEIWADKAGYYIYLPSLFMYHFNAAKIPEKIDEKTGYGFQISEDKKIVTKYTYGVAALVSPFFVLARLISPVFHLPGESGFGPMFHFMVNVAAAFYLVLGLFFLRKFLLRYFRQGMTYLVVFLVYAGTNLLYYSSSDTLMSHIYSFFLFSLFLYSFTRYLEQPGKWRYFLVMSMAFALIILIRPTNGIVIILFFLLDCNSRKDILQRIDRFLKPYRLIAFFLIILLVFLPQLIYWKYSRGSFLSWTYTNEGFTNWNHPKILELWFSPLNGLFIYTPLMLLLITGMIIMIRKRISNGWLLLGLFLFISYLFSSWYNWYYGCSFGQRSYVEYYAVFAIPFGFFLGEIPKIKRILFQYLTILILLAFCYYNVKMSLEFDKCFFGSTWDWAQFNRQLDKAHIFISYKKTRSFENDFENQALSYAFPLSDTIHRSGMYSAHIDPAKEFNSCYSVMINDLGEQLPQFIEVSYWAVNPVGWPLDASLVCAMDINDSVVSWQSVKLPPLTYNPTSWKEIEAKFIIPPDISREPRIKIYFWNPQRNSFFVDDLKIVFK